MTISVTQLNKYIHGIFDIDGVLNDLSVCGEITNVKRSYNGWYFTLKDDDAAINCFCYSDAKEPVAGVMAVAEGQLNYFVKSGSVSFFVRRLTATDNTGSAYQKFVELRDKLSKEGLFDESRKKTVPHSAEKIGVVTSETGAVIHDIVNVALRRQPFTEIYLYPVKVQGVGSEDEIAAGIAYFDKSDVDAVIVGRGGGSNEDLSVFNTEKVVRAIAACNKPVVSAVGHGIDFTLSDFAADKRAVTPSEAAEFVTLDAEREKTRIFAYLDRMSVAVASRLLRERQSVENCCKLLCRGAGRKSDNLQAEIKYLLKQIELAVGNKIQRAEAEIDKSLGKIENANPLNIIKRGFGYISSDGKPIRSVQQLEVGNSVDITLSDGKLSADITHKEANNK